ncbi:hypothetical protein N8500_00220 [Candidatus Puniceispirillum sp.]|nr:hypothetical protein [Candidatus Puniceispirillum sp.]
MSQIIRNSLLAINYGIAVVTCLILIMSQKLSVTDKAIFGFSVIGVGMVLRKIISWILPENEPHTK